MASQAGKSGGLTFGRGDAQEFAKAKQRGHEDIGLLLALVVLVIWALFVGLRGMDWPALSHTVSALVAYIA
ncbi:MAG TPA: hypothetical protein VFZ27_09115 [Terriglobia bacterium]|nr:hypothetical protein [Terriglobia bacterium]